MNGIWFYNDVNDSYRLNVSTNSGKNFKLQFDEESRWNIYKNGGDVTGEGVRYCNREDLSECAGNWMHYDFDIGSFVFNADATSQLLDCNYTECDVIGVEEDDAKCL